MKISNNIGSQIPATREKRPRTGKGEGDKFWFFVFHNLISIAVFFWIAIAVDLFEKQADSLFDIFSFSFVYFLFEVLLISVISGFFGRILTYIPLKLWYNYVSRKEIKSFGQINKGVNEMLSMSYIISTLLSSIIFALGALTIIQSKLFEEDTLGTLILSYLIIKITISAFIYVKYK